MSPHRPPPALDAERIRALLDALDVGVLLQGPAAEILFSNPMARELLGLTEDQLLGRSSFDPRWNVIREDGTSFPGPDHPVPVAIATGRPVRDVVMGVDRPVHGDRVWLLVNAEPDLDSAGAVTSVVCTFRDITAFRELQQQLVEAQRIESVGRLAGGLAHDFNNLLTVIIGTLQLLRRRGDGATVAASAVGGHGELLDQALTAARRAAQLTGQLLSFARRQPVEPLVLDLAGELRAHEPLLERLVGEAVEVAVHCAEHVPPVRFDRTQLEQLLINLATNARDAMPHGGRLELELRQLPEPDRHVVLRVVDTGVGIAPELLPRIFEPFFTTKPTGAGTGLGLSSVQGAVAQAGGRISVQSTPGVGTCFEIRLPPCSEPPAAPGGPAGGHHSSPPLRGAEILLVEDDPGLLDLAARILGEAGCRVTTAGSAAQALTLVRHAAQAPDLLVTDVVMPVSNGADLAATLRAVYPSLRVLFVSGYTPQTLAELGVDSRGIGYLAKPYEPESLTERVRTLLGDRTP